MKYFLRAILVTLLSALILMLLAYYERGRWGFGGEWIAIIGIGYVSFMVAYQYWRNR